MIDEIDNVVADANADMTHRGHVVALAILCATEAVSQFGYEHVAEFIDAHFPEPYRPYSDRLFVEFRNEGLAHGWNLFESTLLPGFEPVQQTEGFLQVGILNLLSALKEAQGRFLAALVTSDTLRWRASERYRRLRNRARP